MRQCDKCSGKIPDEAQFCPHCGDPVTEADVLITAPAESSVAKVEVAFGWSSSPNYSRAVSICERIPTYKQAGEDKEVKHSVKLPITEVDLLINLYDLVGSWRSSIMLINGQQETKSALTQKGMGCYRARQKAYHKEQYCFGEKPHEINIWGCKRLGLPLYHWGGGWLEYGTMDSQGVWHFDKDRLRHELEASVNEYDLCPVLDRKRVLETVDRLPDSIDPKRDGGWAYVTRYEEVRGQYREVATGIKPVLPRAGRYVIGDFQPTWDVVEGENQAEISVSFEQRETPPQKAKPAKSGCLVSIFAAGFLGSLLFWYVLSVLGNFRG